MCREERALVAQTFLGRAGRSGSVEGRVESRGDEAMVLRPKTHSGGSVNKLARLREDRILYRERNKLHNYVYFFYEIKHQ